MENLELMETFQKHLGVFLIGLPEKFQNRLSREIWNDFFEKLVESVSEKNPVEVSNGISEGVPERITQEVPGKFPVVPGRILKEVPKQT